MAPGELLQVTESYQKSVRQSHDEVTAELGQYLRVNIDDVLCQIKKTGSATLIDNDRNQYIYTQEQLLDALS